MGYPLEDIDIRRKIELVANNVIAPWAEGQPGAGRFRQLNKVESLTST
jgi:hypothetical protein